MNSPLALLLLVQTATAPVRVATVTARVTPEAPAIGESITVELRVRAPAGAEVRFPVLPDTGTRIEPLDPRVIRDASTADGVDRIAIYRLIAWDTGSVAVAFSDITVTRDGATQRHPVELGALRIRSVLPADSAQRVPRPAADPLHAPSLRWRLWVALAVILALAVAAHRRWRRWKRERAHAMPDAAGAARSAFVHARALGLLEAGEPGRHLLAHIAVMRRYLAERWPVAGADLTAAQTLFAALEADGMAIIKETGADMASARVRRLADMRYIGQGFEITVALEAACDRESILAAFEAVYRKLFGRTPPGAAVQFVALRVSVTAPMPGAGGKLLLDGKNGRGEALKGYRDVYFADIVEKRRTPVYDRYALTPGTTIAGPAVFEENESTFIVGPGSRISLLPEGSIMAEYVS